MAAAKEGPGLRETDLYGPVRDYLVAQGYTVRSEVQGCDITASKGDELIVVELKRAFSTTLLIQATRRQRIADAVYVALPRPTARHSRSHWRGIEHLLRRLELGLILVSFSTGQPLVEVAFHPLPYERKRDTRRRRAILQEAAGRSGEHNQGGSTRRKIVTAYREQVLFVACCLEKYGPLSPQQLCDLGASPKARSILSSNFYGWFERVGRGVYALNPQGRAALGEYPALVDRFRAMLTQV